MARYAGAPLPYESRHLVREQIQKLKDQREKKLREIDAEIERLQGMIDSGLVPQTCG